MASFEKPSSVFKHTFFYSAGNLLSRGLNFLLLPFYSHFITTNDFGIYSVIISAVTILSTVINLGFPSIFIKNLSEAETDDERKRIFSNIFLLILSISVISFLIILIFVKPLSKFLIGNENYQLEVFLGFLSILIYNLSYYTSSIYITQEDSRKYVSKTAISAILNFVLNLFLIGYLRAGINGIFISQILSSIVLIYLSKDGLEKYFEFKFDKELTKQLLILSLPLFFSGLFSILVEVIDRIFIIKILNESSAGIYSFGYRIALIYNLFILSFKTSWIPHFMKLKHLDEIERSKHIGRIFTKLIYISALIILTITLFTEELFELKISNVNVISTQYQGSSEIIFIVMFGYFFSLMMTFFSPAPYLTNKTIHFLISDLISAVTNVGLNFVLIKTYGIKGAAYSTLIAFFFGFVYLSIYSSRVVKVKYEVKKLILMIGISFIIYMIGKIVNDGFTELALIIILILAGFRLKIFGKKILNNKQNSHLV